MANMSPPIPHPVGSIRPRAALAAIAASTAFPPFFSISRPIWVANGWLVATMPFFPMTSERVAKGCPVILSCAVTEIVAKRKMQKNEIRISYVLLVLNRNVLKFELKINQTNLFFSIAGDFFLEKFNKIEKCGRNP
jgi:hypothetical protein